MSLNREQHAFLSEYLYRPVGAAALQDAVEVVPAGSVTSQIVAEPAPQLEIVSPDEVTSPANAATDPLTPRKVKAIIEAKAREAKPATDTETKPAPAPFAPIEGSAPSTHRKGATSPTKEAAPLAGKRRRERLGRIAGRMVGGLFAAGFALTFIAPHVSINEPASAQNTAPTTTEVPHEVTTTSAVTTTTEVKPQATVTTEAPTTTIKKEKPSVAPTTTAAPTTTEAPTTTVAPTTTEAPQPKSITDQVHAGELDVKDLRGMFVGQLALDKYCDVVDIYVENWVDYTSKVNFDFLTPEAQAKVLRLQLGGLSNDEQRMLKDDILQKGLPGEAGSPMYYLQEKDPAEQAEIDANCVPAAVNPRATRVAYGSTEAVANGGFAIQYQAIADVLYEFNALPGGAGKVTYIQGHRSSQSAAFEGLTDYQVGDTVTYTGDNDISLHYKMVDRITIDAGISIDALKDMLTQQANGKEQLALQYCIEDQPDTRYISIFELA